jgi:DNA-binding PadR family transcriptional regulator
MLEDLGFVSAGRDGEKRVFQLTDEGRAELEARADQVEGFWQRFGAPADSGCQTELRFLRDEMEQLGLTVWRGLRHAAEAGDVETIRAVRDLVEKCKSEVRRLASERSE